MKCIKFWIFFVQTWWRLYTNWLHFYRKKIKWNDVANVSSMQNKIKSNLTLQCKQKRKRNARRHINTIFSIQSNRSVHYSFSVHLSPFCRLHILCKIDRVRDCAPVLQYLKDFYHWNGRSRQWLSFTHSCKNKLAGKVKSPAIHFDYGDTHFRFRNSVAMATNIGKNGCRSTWNG